MNLHQKIKEGNNTFTYDQRGNVLTSKNQEGIVSYTYDNFDNVTKVKDTKGKEVTYKYNKENHLIHETYANVRVDYTFNEYDLLESVTKNGSRIASYTYNNRGEVTSLKQKDALTTKTYDDMGRVLTQRSANQNRFVYDAIYKYDEMDNLIEETIDDKKNTYQYNDYDELVFTHKYLDGKFVDTKYAYDMFGNQITSGDHGMAKKYIYNDKNQIKEIQTQKGTIDLSYDKNGNMISKTHEDGSQETYTYNAFDKLETYSKGQYTYTYKYDGEQNRIQKIQTDHKDYHYDVWYDYDVDIDLIGKEKFKDHFQRLEKQVAKKKANKGVCSYQESDKYDVTYFKEDVTTNYLLDRTKENTQILAVNDEISVYGAGLIEEDNKMIIQGMNQSVVADVSGNKVEKYLYDDYGNSNKEEGHGYNGEYKDETGFLYLRARYYDPSMARFISIDNNYTGEAEDINTQNRYVYTLNNPYKFVDRDGNVSFAEMTYGPNYYGTNNSKPKPTQNNKKPKPKPKRDKNEYKATKNAMEKMQKTQLSSTQYAELKDYVSSVAKNLGIELSGEILNKAIDHFGNMSIGSISLSYAKKYLLSLVSGSKIEVFKCKDPIGKSTYDPRPMNHGQSLEKQAGTLKPAPDPYDAENWYLKIRTVISKEQLETSKALLFGLFDVAFSVMSFTPAGAYFAVISVATSVYSDTHSYKQEIEKAEDYVFVDLFNSTMLGTVYFNKNNKVIGRTGPQIYTN